MTEGRPESCSPLAAHESEAKFDHVYQRNFSSIYTYFLRRAGRDEVADLVSDVFLIAWRRLDQVPQPPEDRLWLYGVARRVMSQHSRSTMRRRRLAIRIRHDAVLPRADEAPPDAAMSSRVSGLLEHLRPKDREVVKLIAWDGLSNAEVASVLGCTPNAVAIRWHRSLKHLRSRLGISDGSIDPAQAGGT